MIRPLRFAKFIITPKTQNITQPAAPTTQPSAISSHVLPPPQASPECDALRNLIKRFNDQNTIFKNAINTYTEFGYKMDQINASFKSLQLPLVLTKETVKTEVTDNFIVPFNTFIGLKGLSVNADPERVSSVELQAIEQKYYKPIDIAIKELKSIEKEADDLTGKDCPSEFLPLYKKFSTANKEFQSEIDDFVKDYYSKILKTFTAELSLFNSLKGYMKSIPTFVTKAIIIDKDVHTVRIYTKDMGQDQKIKWDEITIEPKRGWKLDVAGGFFVSGLSDRLYTKKTMDSIYTKKYVLDGTVRDTTVMATFTSINKQNQSNIGFGGMLYLHAHTQNSTFFNYGVALGFGALFNDQARWAGSFGPTFLIGKKQRFNINPGVIISQVDRLSSPYETGKWYSETIDNIPTYKAWNLSWIVGFSWNF